MTTQYVALLRGINVGGNHKVEMSKLKQIFEQLGFENVKTVIASGNVIFRTTEKNRTTLAKKIEKVIAAEFHINISVLLRDFADIDALVKELPAHWVNDTEAKCDVMFLWPEIDKAATLKLLPIDPELEEVRYFPGAIVWRIDRTLMGKSKMTKIVGTKLYKLMTVRNPNTVRKLHALML